MKQTIQTRNIFTENMLPSAVQDILLFWNTDLQQTIDIMDIQNISNKIKQKIKHRFKACLQYLEKKNILQYIDIHKDTYYAFIILFTLYSAI